MRIGVAPTGWKIHAVHDGGQLVGNSYCHTQVAVLAGQVDVLNVDCNLCRMACGLGKLDPKHKRRHSFTLLGRLEEVQDAERLVP